MFNVIISADNIAWERPSFVLDAERFLEYTDDETTKQFQALDEAAKKLLMKLPTLFAYESPSPKPARVGTLTSIQKQGREIRITYAFDPSIEPIDPERVPAIAWDAFEMTRTHWAVKDGDLLEVLFRSEVATAAEPAAGSPQEPTDSFSRATLLNACDMFPALGHSGFDRFLLEVGIDGINAGRERGGLSTRATALAEFVVRNPSARTIEGEPVGLVVVRKAVELDPQYPKGIVYNVTDHGRDAFWKALERDGYAARDGEIVPVAASSTRSAAVTRVTPMLSPRGKKIFLVHGRDDGAKHEVARFLERLGLEVVILHERPNSGRTLITKFREESADVGFAVVLMTPDDVGGMKDQAAAPRARQNVVFELGFFVGKLGPKRVCALIAGAVEKPSDFEGVVYVPFGPGTSWRNDLARELLAAGIPFDPAKLLG